MAKRPKRELTPMKMKRGLPQRWRRQYKGQQYFFRGSYAEALDEWHKLLGKLTAEKPWKAEYDHAIRTRRAMAAWYLAQGDRDNQRRMTDEADQLQAQFDSSDNPLRLHILIRDPLRGISPEGAAVWAERFRLMADQGSQSPDKTIGGAVGSFLARKKVQAEAGERSMGRYDGYRRCLTDFTDWAGKDTPCDHINTKMLLDYHSHLLGLVASDKISRGYAKDHMTAVKVFVNWAWSLELCDLPRNMKSRDLAIKVELKEIQTFTVAEVQTLLAAASGRTKLYLLLGANCGFTQFDIARLRRDEINLETGYLTHKRTKTAEHKDVPVVSYKLWATTLDLLRAELAQQPADQPLAMLNEDGKPLKREWIGADGKKKRVDNIRTAYERLTAKLKLKTPKPFKLLRKTGATLLASSPDYRHCDVLYLGHSPRGMAARFYSAPDRKTFHAALDWLGQQLGQQGRAVATEQTSSRSAASPTTHHSI
jgi:integrase